MGETKVGLLDRGVSGGISDLLGDLSASSCYEDALAEAVYEELDYLVTQKEGLLGSPEAPDQRTDAPGEDYDDGEEVPVPGALHDSQGSKEEVLPEKEDGMRSQIAWKQIFPELLYEHRSPVMQNFHMN